MDFVEMVALIAAMQKSEKGYVPPVNDNDMDDMLEKIRGANIPGVKV
jgi:hypothetical protein